jgi:hypothetical protein
VLISGPAPIVASVEVQKTTTPRLLGDSMTPAKSSLSLSNNQWVRIPDGTKVRHRTEGYEGVIDLSTQQEMNR